MTAAPKLKWREVPISLIDIPREYVRNKPNDDADKALAASVKLSGIHQPLAVIPHDVTSHDITSHRFLLVKGTRRIAAAEENGIERVPVIVNFPPTGISKPDLKKYRDRLRFILDSKRQDLTPSQRWTVVKEAQNKFGMNNKEVAALIGFDAGTITNWSRIEHYAKPIVLAIDRGDITLHHAQAFDGMKPAAQIKVFAGMRGVATNVSGRKLHTMVRKQFAPSKFPNMWEQPAKSAQKIQKRTAKRQQLIKARSKPVSAAELASLNDNLEMLQTEHDDNKAMIERANRLLQLLAPVHRAVSNDEELLNYVASRWPQHVPALERFSEIA